MFNAVFFGGFQDVYHKPHSYYISRYPPGPRGHGVVAVTGPEVAQRLEVRRAHHDVVHREVGFTVTFWSTKRYDIESITGER